MNHPDLRKASLVISGDTAYTPKLAEFAKHADVHGHEVMHLGGLEKLLERGPNAAALREHLIASHTVPEDVGSGRIGHHLALEVGWIRVLKIPKRTTETAPMRSGRVRE